MSALIIDYKSAVSGELAKLIGQLEGPEILEAMGHEVQRLTTDHLTMIAQTRHATAERLGAQPSNHWAQAAEKVAAPGALEVDAAAATLTVSHPGIRRALQDVTIVPKEAQSLAIPVDAIAYNRRPAQIWAELNLFIPKGKDYIAMTGAGGEIRVLYILRRSVTQKQDRSLLPTNEEFSEAAAEGGRGFIRMSLANTGGASLS